MAKPKTPGKASSTEPNKGGRPRIDIDWDVVSKLCGIQCTLAEIANFCEVSEDTIERACKRDHNMGFAEYFSQKRSSGTVSLRRKQYETAMNGNVTMQIWLGKQWLGQSDKLEERIEAKLTAKATVSTIDAHKLTSMDEQALSDLYNQLLKS